MQFNTLDLIETVASIVVETLSFLKYKEKTDIQSGQGVLNIK